MSRKLKALGSGVAVASMLLLSACGSGGSPETAPETPADTPAELSAEAQAALEIVEAVSQPYDEFVAPGPALDGLDSLGGKTVHYIVAQQGVPMFGIIADALSEALGQFDIDVQVCDAKASPEGAASCISQALDANAAAVISGSLPEEMAQTAFAQVREAGLPLVFTQVQPEDPTGQDDPSKVAYISPDNAEMQGWNANWVIADSDAKADVLVVKVTDTPATIAWTDFGSLPTYENACAECNVEVIEATTYQLDKVPSLISAALTKNPNIGYIQSPFAIMDDSIKQGVQAAARDDVKIVSGDSALAQLQDLASGGLIKAVVGNSSPAFGWYVADETLRLLSGEESVQNHPFPFRRLLTEEIAKGLDLTPEGEANGSWYGEADYQAGFKELWSVQ